MESNKALDRINKANKMLDELKSSNIKISDNLSVREVCIFLLEETIDNLYKGVLYE